MATHRFGFLGAGRMATALAQGFVQAGLAAPHAIIASDPIEAARADFTRVTGCSTSTENLAVARAADCLVLAVKPQNTAALLDELRGAPTAGKLVVSIVAGFTLEQLRAGLGEGVRLARVMPNTPCLVGQGASAYCLAPGATEADASLVQQMLAAVGQTHAVPEKLLDAVTGLSGSGPAFVMLMIEALSDGGVRMGLPRALATALAAQTLKGAAELLLQTGQHPGVLKDQVASPGGTTIAGLQVLEQHGVRGALIDAVVAATERSQELGRAG